jgi:hypothetical protein
VLLCGQYHFKQIEKEITMTQYLIQVELRYTKIPLGDHFFVGHCQWLGEKIIETVSPTLPSEEPLPKPKTYKTKAGVKKGIDALRKRYGELYYFRAVPLNEYLDYEQHNLPLKPFEESYLGEESY